MSGRDTQCRVYDVRDNICRRFATTVGILFSARHSETIDLRVSKTIFLSPTDGRHVDSEAWSKVRASSSLVLAEIPVGPHKAGNSDWRTVCGFVPVTFSREHRLCGKNDRLKKKIEFRRTTNVRRRNSEVNRDKCHVSGCTVHGKTFPGASATNECR